MYWVIGAVAVGALVWLSSEEDSARSDYQNAGRHLERETKKRRAELASIRKNRALAADFYRHNELYFASVQTANACYDLYDKQKKLVKMFAQKKAMFDQQITELKKQRDTATGQQKQAIREELTKTREYFAQAKEQLAVLAEEKERLLAEVRYLNQETRELKLYMRDNCGKKGRDWYQRGLERQRAS